MFLISWESLTTVISPPRTALIDSPRSAPLLCLLRLSIPPVLCGDNGTERLSTEVEDSSGDIVACHHYCMDFRDSLLYSTLPSAQTPLSSPRLSTVVIYRGVQSYGLFASGLLPQKLGRHYCPSRRLRSTIETTNYSTLIIPSL